MKRVGWCNVRTDNAVREADRLQFDFGLSLCSEELESYLSKASTEGRAGIIKGAQD
jgi:hypothetical protein